MIGRRPLAGNGERAQSQVVWFQNHVVNPLVCAVLRSPLHRLLSRAVLLLTYRGRKTGDAYTLPVQYAPWGDHRLVVWPARPEAKVWWRNVSDGAALDVRVGGSEKTATARVLREANPVREAAIHAYRDRFPKAGARLAAEDDGSPLFGLELQRTRSA